MAGEKISISLEVLDKQIEALDSLINDTQLSDLITDIQNTLITSQGDTVVNEIETDIQLGKLQENMLLLFQRARDFLANTHTNFFETDSAS